MTTTTITGHRGARTFWAVNDFDLIDHRPLRGADHLTSDVSGFAQARQARQVAV